MQLRVRGKLFLAMLAVTAVCVIAADAYLSSSLSRSLTQRIQDDLTVRLALVERAAEETAAPLDDLAAWDARADALGERAQARVTVIRTDGVVIGDSQVALADLPAVENHAGRPEIAAALAQGSGVASRLSRTVRERMLYVAMPFRRGGQVAGVVRAAVPLAAVDRALASTRWLLLAASLLAIGVASVALVALTGRLTRVVAVMTEAARRMAAGDLDARTRVSGGDELGELGRTLDHLADELSGSLGELREERDLLSGILDAMHEGVILVDADRRIALVNPALREMLLLPADVVGQRPLEAIRHAELQELLARVGATRAPAAVEIEVSGVRPRRLLARASPLAPGSDETVVVFIDVTDLRKLESLRRDFVANVSHELRTPVTAVRSAAETLRDAQVRDPEAAGRFIDIIERNAERLQALVDDLLDLSRMDSRQYQLRLEAVDLPAFFQQVVEPMRERAEKKGIALVVDLPAAAAALRPRADPRALEQVLSNLVDNAIKYCAAGATVRLSAGSGANGRELELSVSDDGPGIEARHLPRIFERFYRVDAGRAREQGGTGLGLSIVKNLVEAMTGRVTVDSAPGRGSTFHVFLPRAESP
jgi:two-component system, OmpR family, phosphate regulon sensor histidine kinase PhoR